MSSFVASMTPCRVTEVEFGGEGAAAHGHLPSGDLLTEPLAPLSVEKGDEDEAEAGRRRTTMGGDWNIGLVWDNDG